MTTRLCASTDLFFKRDLARRFSALLMVVLVGPFVLLVMLVFLGLPLVGLAVLLLS